MALSEREARRYAYASLINFAEITFTAYRASWHHAEIAGALEWVKDTPGARLIITMPPRHGKTELASIRFAPWLLAHGALSVIAATYAQDFADEIGRKARAVMQSRVYRALFPSAQLDRTSQAVSRWQTANGGSYYAVGVGGPLTGRGADVLLIDDPHKNRQEAESKVVRGAVWDWFRSTAYTRLEKGGRVVIIMTRWHEDDLVARCLATGEPWRVLSLPAVAEQDEQHRRAGDALWPEKYSVETLARVRETVGEREWSALYQQRPSPLAGGLFKPDRIVVVDAEPAGTEWVRAWDFGATDGGGDPTAGARIGKMPDGRYCIGDMAHDQLGPDGVVALLKATASRDGVRTTIHLPQDPGQAGKAQAQYMTRELAGYAVKVTPESGDKVLRAEPFAAQVNVGNVVMMRSAWNQALIEELRMFPNGAHDDQVDALSRGFSAFYAPSNTGMLDFYRQEAERIKAMSAHA